MERMSAHDWALLILVNAGVLRTCSRHPGHLIRRGDRGDREFAKSMALHAPDRIGLILLMDKLTAEAATTCPACRLEAAAAA